MPSQLQSPEVQAFATGFPVTLLHAGVTLIMLVLGTTLYALMTPHKEIALIRGYKKDAITLPNIRYYDNDRYEETGELFRITSRGSGNDLAVEARGIDVRLERAPAREAILTGDIELGLVELRGGIVSAQLGEPFLRSLLQPVDVGVGGKRLRHGTPSFSAPGVRSSRARKKESVLRLLEVGSTLHADRRSPARPRSDYRQATGKSNKGAALASVRGRASP